MSKIVNIVAKIAFFLAVSFSLFVAFENAVSAVATFPAIWLNFQYHPVQIIVFLVSPFILLATNALFISKNRNSRSDLLLILLSLITVSAELALMI